MCTLINDRIDNSQFHCSTFETIEELSQKMLAKGDITRFVDKEEDSKTVARLVERLRQAIVCYQASGDHAAVSGIIDM